MAVSGEVIGVGVAVVAVAISAVTALGVAIWSRPKEPPAAARPSDATAPPASPRTLPPGSIPPASPRTLPPGSIPPASPRTLPPGPRPAEAQRDPPSIPEDPLDGGAAPVVAPHEEEDLTVFGDDAPVPDPSDPEIDGLLAVAIPLLADPEAANDEPTDEGELLLLSAVGHSDVGLRREGNEDSYVAAEDLALFVIADGMGGHAGGEVASRMAVDAVERRLRAGEAEAAAFPGLTPRANRLAQAIQLANRQVWDRAEREPDLRGMGTTLVAAWFVVGKRRVYLGHVGDSRIYRLRDGRLEMLTADHTLGALGMGGRFAAHLARAVGAEPAVVIDLITGVVLAGDRYLLCSDGLSKMASDDEIKRLLVENPEPAGAVGALIGRANQLGGRDNITVIVVQVTAASRG